MAEAEQVALSREWDFDHEALAPSHTDVLGAVLAVALIVTPWFLIGWLVWLLA
jgi:hypothetical protein